MRRWQQVGAGLVAVVMLTGCETGSVPQRVRKQWDVPASRSEREIVRDYEQCNVQAQEKARGLMGAGSALGSVGVYALPLVPVGLVLTLAGVRQMKTALHTCMLEAGYHVKRESDLQEVTEHRRG